MKTAPLCRENQPHKSFCLFQSWTVPGTVRLILTLNCTVANEQIENWIPQSKNLSQPADQLLKCWSAQFNWHYQRSKNNINTWINSTSNICINCKQQRWRAARLTFLPNLARYGMYWTSVTFELRQWVVSREQCSISQPATEANQLLAVRAALQSRTLLHVQTGMDTNQTCRRSSNVQLVLRLPCVSLYFPLSLLFHFLQLKLHAARLFMM